MKKVEEFLDKYLTPLAGWVSSNKIISSIAAGMVAIMPLSLVASVFSIVNTLLGLILGEGYSPELSNIINTPYNFIFAILALVVSFTVAYNYARKLEMNPVMSGICSLVTFMLISSTYVGAFMADSTMTATYFGSQGIFTAIFVGITSVGLYKLILTAGLRVKMPEEVPGNIKDAFESFIPFTLVVAVFYFGNMLVKSASGQTIPYLISSALSGLVSFADSPTYIIAACVLQEIFWWLGMHGWMLISAPLLGVTGGMLAANAAAKAAGEALPYICVEGYSYGYMTKMWVPLLFILFSKSKRNKSIGKMTLVPGIFGITEPWLFGIPVVMNPFFLLPNCLAGAVLGVYSYAVIKLGLLNRVYQQALSIIPTPFNTFIATGFDFRAFIWFIPAVLIMCVIWVPFIKVWDKKCLEEEAAAQEKE